MTKALQPNCVFERVEKKYKLSDEQYRRFVAGLKGKMAVDDYGRHTICNLYYDTPSDELIRRSIEKPKYKEKIRLRSYGIPTPESTVFLEIKKKWKKVVYKRRIPLTLRQAEAYMNRGVLPKVPPEDQQILNEIDYCCSFYHPVAKVFLAYDRIALAGVEDPELRMTFDDGIRSRHHHLSLLAGDGGEPLIGPQEHLLEIKVASAYPLWLVRLLSQLKIYPVSFSKYGNVYKKRLIQEGGHPCSQVS